METEAQRGYVAKTGVVRGRGVRLSDSGSDTLLTTAPAFSPDAQGDAAPPSLLRRSRGLKRLLFQAQKNGNFVTTG